MKGKTHAGIGAVTFMFICDKLPEDLVTLD
jgi:hypothetical protein